MEEQQRSGFRYQYSTYQMEYSRNLQFQVGQQMEEVFQALMDRSRSLLNLNRVKTIFGAKNRPHHRRRNRNPTRWGVVVETPTYDDGVQGALWQIDAEDLYQRRTRAPHRSDRA